MEEHYRRSERVMIKEKLRRQRSLREQWLLILGTSFFGLKNSNICKCISRCVEALELSGDWYPKSVIVLTLLMIILELQSSCSHQVHNNITSKQRREDNMIFPESLRPVDFTDTALTPCLSGRGVCNIFWKATIVPWITCSPKAKLLILWECIFGV